MAADEYQTKLETEAAERQKIENIRAAWFGSTKAVAPTRAEARRNWKRLFDDKPLHRVAQRFLDRKADERPMTADELFRALSDEGLVAKAKEYWSEKFPTSTKNGVCTVILSSLRGGKGTRGESYTGDGNVQ